jgi:hypothetical protein
MDPCMHVRMARFVQRRGMQSCKPLSFQHHSCEYEKVYAAACIAAFLSVASSRHGTARYGLAMHERTIRTLSAHARVLACLQV